MADSGTKKKKGPGKLKFNPMMFNPGAMRPGAKNDKLEALKNKRNKEREEKGDEVASTEAEFEKPSRPKRRTKSKRSFQMVDLDVDEMKHSFAPSLTIENDATLAAETSTATTETTAPAQQTAPQNTSVDAATADETKTATADNVDADEASTPLININLPRVYADANKDHHLDVDNLEIEVESTADWKIFQRIGRGKYSEVFEGKQMSTGLVACVKILKPCLPKLLKLEIYTLQLLKQGPNIIQLMHTLRDGRTELWCLVFEILKCKELKDTLKELSDGDLRLFMYETLRALDYAHSKGIMHRDVKPQNILIDVEGKNVRVIDWGLATFYYPNEKYSVRVATRAFKAPELLVEHQQYHYAVDMWAFGCMFAGILYGKNFFFHGKDFAEQLRLHVECLGTAQFQAFLQKYSIKPPDFVNDYPECAGKKWTDYVDAKTNKRFMCDESLDLVGKILRFDPNERLTANEAMQHPYFDEVRPKIENNQNQNDDHDAKSTEQ